MVTNYKTTAAKLAAHLLPREQVYLCWESDGAPRMVPGALGYTMPTLDVRLRSWLEDHNSWHGRGVAIFLGDVLLAERHNSDCLYSADEVLAGLICHEVGHIADSGIDRKEITPAVEVHACKMESLSDSVSAGELPDLPLWFGHRDTWLRATLHCWYRGSRLMNIPLPTLFDGEFYGLLPPWRFKAALSAEFEPLENVRLTALKLLPAPEKFLSLFPSGVVK